MKQIIFRIFTITVMAALGSSSSPAQVAAGGAFKVEKSVVATGGGASSGSAFAVTGTGGQAAAGTTAANATFSQTAGFWTPDQLAPTAAGVTVEGRVTTADGRGIRNARVTMTASDGSVRSVATGSFGFFRFTDVAAGEIYVFGVSAKRFTFAVPTQVLTVVESVAGLSFVADTEP